MRRKADRAAKRLRQRKRKKTAPSPPLTNAASVTNQSGDEPKQLRGSSKDYENLPLSKY